MTRFFLVGVSRITSETIHVIPVSSAYLAQRITLHGPLNVLVVLGLSQVWPYLGRVIMMVFTTYGYSLYCRSGT